MAIGDATKEIHLQCTLWDTTAELRWWNPAPFETPQSQYNPIRLEDDNVSTNVQADSARATRLQSQTNWKYDDSIWNTAEEREDQWEYSWIPEIFEAHCVMHPGGHTDMALQMCFFDFGEEIEDATNAAGELIFSPLLSGATNQSQARAISHANLVTHGVFDSFMSNPDFFPAGETDQNVADWGTVIRCNKNVSSKGIMNISQYVMKIFALPAGTVM